LAAVMSLDDRDSSSALRRMGRRRVVGDASGAASTTLEVIRAPRSAAPSHAAPVAATTRSGLS